MAAVAEEMPVPPGQDDKLFVRGAFLMTLVIVTGFSMQLAAGRSTFASPPLVHAHAVVFMGWVFIYLLQNVFAATGRSALHRRLGWLAAFWMLPMLVLGSAVTVNMIRQAHVPFFFRPLQFLVFDPASLIAFAGLTTAAIMLRRRTDWHRRLHFCAMSMLLGPGFGRLLPSPLLIPWAWEVTLLASVAFPVVAMLIDARRGGGVHPAWRWGLAVFAVTLVLVEAVTYSPVGDALYRAVAAGTPGAAVAPLGFPPPPAGPPPGP